METCPYCDAAKEKRYNPSLVPDLFHDLYICGTFAEVYGPKIQMVQSDPCKATQNALELIDAE